MNNFWLIATSPQQFWHAVPLIVAVSLVYSATRHELMGPILTHALRVGAWIIGFMLLLLAVLQFLSWQT